MASPRPFHVLAALGLWSLASAALAQPAVQPATEADLTAFKETVERYTDRMESFSDDARALITDAEAAERARIDEVYGAQIAELDQRHEDLRGEAIARFEAFLRKYPDSESSAHAMFRLGDLYYEKTENDFLVETEEYEKLMAGFDFDTATEVPESPLKDYGRSIALYNRIIADHPDYEYVDGAYYMLGFCLARDLSAQYDEEESRQVFQALVDRYPESQFAVAAHLRLGEYYFDYNQIDLAIPHYEAVIRLATEDGELYDEGLYKLAWSYYKQSDYQRSLDLFTRLLDWSATNFVKTGSESPTAPEAVEYMAISFSDLSDEALEAPVDVARGFFQRVGEREFEKDVFVRLATVLTDQARFQDAIDVYAYLQDRWPDDPENPTHQWRIAQINYVLEDQDAAQAAIQELTERYNDETTWWTANRADPDAQAVARGYIERSLAAVATGYHSQGLETGDTTALAKAAELYGQYLRKFPFASDYYEIQWYRADTLLKTGQLPEAEVEYVQLLKAEGHPYRDGALWNLMQVRKERLMQRYTTFDKRPEDAVEESRVALESGRERVIWALSEDHQAFIASVEALLSADLKEPDYREALENNRVPLQYIVAQIYYHHGRYDEARPRLEELIFQHPEWEEAAFAASMMLNSYQDEENLQKLQILAAQYAGLPLGGGKKVREFSDLAEGAAFKLAEQLIAKDRLEAARAFEQFMTDYPRSKYLTDAHYNAANSYEVAGRVDDANRLFKSYIDKIEAGVYKQDDRSRALYFRIASNYSEVLDLENAIKYYEALYQRFPDYQDSSAALYNAAFLRIGLSDHRGAATNFERYSSLSPAPADAEQVMFAAGLQWEQVGAGEAIEFYRRYLRRFPSESPDRVMEAHYRIAELVGGQGNERQTDRAWAELAEAYQRLAPSGQVGPRGRHYAAMAELRILEDEYAAFAEVEFTKNEERNVKILTEIKPAQLTAVEDRVTRIVASYADFDASSAGLYYVGKAYLGYSDMLYNAPPPRGLDQESLDFYYEEIDKRRIPVEDKGRQRLETNLEKARTEKRWNEWCTKTLEVLADRFPSDFAREKEELRGGSDTNVVPRAGIMELRAPLAADAAPADAPSDAPSPAAPATEAPATEAPATEGGAQ